MVGDLTVVLDIGKTLAKLTLWDAQGRAVERRTRRNAAADSVGPATLDVAGVEAWIAETLSDFARLGRVATIVPVGHGAAAAVIRDGRLVAPPADYEAAIPAEQRAAYDAERDPFVRTGSPALPNGLNLGAQLHALEAANPQALAAGATILTWPQYWAWLLSGVAACEVSSLGCHSDLWRPLEGGPSNLALRRGWAERLAPVRRADAVLGVITPGWAARTGLPADVRVLCGLHDSNAALLAARGFAEIADHESTVLSTGTWFVAMRSPAEGATIDIAGLDETRDCLVNVDVNGKPIPSARFMGGREVERLSGIDTLSMDLSRDQPALLAALDQVLAGPAMVLPTWATGVGPFPGGRGGWVNRPGEPIVRRAAVCLYLALVADAALDLIGARERILVEGRFAEADLFLRALAALRPADVIYASNADNDVSYGALRLIDPGLPPSSTLRRIEPVEADMLAYRQSWRRAAGGMEVAA